MLPFVFGVAVGLIGAVLLGEWIRLRSERMRKEVDEMFSRVQRESDERVAAWRRGKR